MQTGMHGNLLGKRGGLLLLFCLLLFEVFPLLRNYITRMCVCEREETGVNDNHCGTYCAWNSMLEHLIMRGIRLYLSTSMSSALSRRKMTQK